ncbi:unnamed protein product [Brachionus calyciflorus]|uniref:Uncharacterized protein n=1 Tax=Brachionus calyciflorus TaxID=104777 RepID=A0A813SNM3_9BILA|nr:unnamed protein product [Brachionus calyciflorus]
MNVTHIDYSKFESIYHSLRPLLANQEITKCIVKDDCISLIKCPFQEIESIIDGNLIVKDKFIQLLINTISSFHNSNVCSTKTAIIFTLILFKEIKYFKQINNLDNRKLSNSLNKILAKSIELIKSEHLIHLRDLNENFIKSLCRNDNSITHLVNSFVKKLKNKKFDQDDILYLSSNTNYLSNSTNSFNFRVKNGLYLSLNDEIYSKFKHLNLKNLQTIIFDANISYDYAHLGFNKNLNMEKFTSNLSGYSSDEIWFNKLTNILLSYKIEMIIAKGYLDKKVQDFCDLNNILVLKNFKNLNLFRNNCLTYIEDFDEEKLLSVEISFLEKESKFDEKCLSGNYIKISNSDCDRLISIIIESRLKINETIILESLKHNLKRLENVLKNGYYVKGGGFIEEFLGNNIKYLKGINGDLYLEYAKEILENSFNVLCNLFKSNQSDNMIYFDDFKSKSKAWQTALWINNIYLNTDLLLD